MTSLLALAICTQLPAATKPLPSDAPNIVLVVSDDLGYGDLSCYGNTDFTTPEIDDLAACGVRCSQAYVTCPICGPSRAGILTGRSGTRYGVEYNLPAKFRQAELFGLPTDQPTLAERLRDAGYETLMVGKWHLGVGAGKTPLERGFDHFFGFYEGGNRYFPGTFNHTIYDDAQPTTVNEYLTKAFNKRAVQYVKENTGHPFFLYLAQLAPHAPWQAPYSAIQQYEYLPSPRKTIAAMIRVMDDGIGELRAALRRNNLLQKTIFVFMSDNGGYIRGGASSNAPLKGAKDTMFEGGIRVPFIVSWPGVLPKGVEYRMPVSSLDIVPTALAVARITPSDAGNLEGVDLIPSLQRPGLLSWSRSPHQSLFWKKGPLWAVRYRNYKLKYNMADGVAGSALYDLGTDIGEAHPITDKPLVTSKLRAMWEDWDSRNVPPLWNSEDE